MTDIIERFEFKVEVVVKVVVKVEVEVEAVRGPFGVSSFVTHSLARLWLFLVFVSSRDKICGRKGQTDETAIWIMPIILRPGRKM